MRKSFIFLTAILILLVVPAYALAAEYSFTNRIYTDSTKVFVDSSIQVKYTIFGKSPKGEYSSTDTSIATVSNEGLITGISPGVVTIKAKVSYGTTNALTGCNENDSISSDLEIKVIAKEDYYVNDITIVEGVEAKAEVIFPEDYTGTTKGTWNIDDTTVADIDAEGLIKALKVGSTIASYVNDEVKIETEFSITVEELFHLSISQNNIFEGINQAVNLTYNFKYKKLPIGTWKSSDPDKVSVDKNGILSIHKGDIDAASEIVITYTNSETSVSRSISVRAWKPIKVLPEVLNLKVLESGAFQITFADGYHGDQSGTWSIEDDSVATIDPDSGQIYGIQEGTTTVTFEHAASGVKEDVSLVVLPAGEPTPPASPTPIIYPSPSPITEPSPAIIMPTHTPASTPMPTPEPSPMPTPKPSPMPTPKPSPMPTSEPSPMPTPEPTPMPTPEPSPIPTPEPSPIPTPEPSPMPTPEPSPMPTPEPSPIPTPEPSPMPTPEPSPMPTPEPSPMPTM